MIDFVTSKANVQNHHPVKYHFFKMMILSDKIHLTG